MATVLLTCSDILNFMELDVKKFSHSENVYRSHDLKSIEILNQSTGGDFK